MKEVVWTEIAESDLELLIKYLRENWSAKVLLYFKLQLEKEINRIVLNPKQFPFLNKKRNYRKCVISKHNTLIYKEFEDNIVLLRIFDTRQNPEKKIYS